MIFEIHREGNLQCHLLYLFCSVDDDYERMRIQKEKEREALRQQIEARKKEEARIAAKEAEEKRHHREQEKEIKKHQREQERMSRQDELLAKQIEEKKRIEDIRREAKEKRSQGMTTVTKPEGGVHDAWGGRGHGVPSLSAHSMFEDFCSFSFPEWPLLVRLN